MRFQKPTGLHRGTPGQVELQSRLQLQEIRFCTESVQPSGLSVKKKRLEHCFSKNQKLRPILPKIGDQGQIFKNPEVETNPLENRT
jgi:hypothetical protein